jgi:hypothetical protein
MLRSLALSLVAVLGVTSVSFGQAASTTEYGITITQDEIISAIQESQEFWAGVRKHVNSDKFAVADAKLRATATKFLKDVDAKLGERLFSSDPKVAQDLLDFLANRLRKFAMYREVRGVLGNDALLCRVKEHWEMGHRGVCLKPEAEREAATKQLLSEIESMLTTAHVEPAKVAKAMGVWKNLSHNMDKLHNTGVGGMMQECETTIRLGDPKLKHLLASVARAADWALIVKTDKPIKTADFVAAWENCLKFDQQQAAATQKPLK